MKLDVLDDSLEVQGSEMESVDYSMSPNQSQLLFKILSQYSNPIGSIVREITTNGFDAHVEAGNTTSPVRVRIVESSLVRGVDNAFEVEDYGVGLSPERIREVFTKFLASTKREGNNEHGAFGLGSKSPLSYVQGFFVTTFVDGVKYEYFIHKAKGVPSLNKMNEEPTSRENGTIVRVPIDKDSDISLFKREISRQLAYFDNIIYENCGVDNEFSIYEGEHFYYIPDRYDEMHIVLGKVFYPLDKSALYSSRYDRPNILKLPIGLKFDIGDVPIVWNRENIEYTEKAKEIIKDKIEKAKQELQDKYNSLFDNISTMEEFVDALTKRQSGSMELKEGVTLYVKNAINTNPSYPKYSDLKIPRSLNELLSDYYVYKKVEQGLIDSDAFLPSLSDFLRNSRDNPLYFVEDRYKTKTNKYLHHKQHNGSVFYLARKEATPTEREKYFYGQKNWTDDLIKQAKQFRQELDDYITSTIDSYEDVEVPESFTEELKEIESSNTNAVPEVEKNNFVPVKYVAVNTKQWWSKDLKFTEDQLTLGALLERKELMIYGHQENSDQLLAVGSLLSHHSELFEAKGSYQSAFKHGRACLLKISKKNGRKVEHLPNFIHVEDLIKAENNRLFKAMATADYMQNNSIDSEQLNKAKALWPVKLSEEIDLLTRMQNKFRDPKKPGSSAGNLIRKEILEKAPIDQEVVYATELFQFMIDHFKFIFKSSLSRYEVSERFLEDMQIYLRAKTRVNPKLLFKKHLKTEKENN